MKWVLTALVLIVYTLHHDYWNWHDKSLVFGFLPKGLAYHGFFCLLASALLAVLVKFAWPSHLEREVESSGRADVVMEDH
jgi:hypothetical protein